MFWASRLFPIFAISSRLIALWYAILSTRIKFVFFDSYLKKKIANTIKLENFKKHSLNGPTYVELYLRIAFLLTYLPRGHNKAESVQFSTLSRHSQSLLLLYQIISPSPFFCRSLGMFRGRVFHSAVLFFFHMTCLFPLLSEHKL